MTNPLEEVAEVRALFGLAEGGLTVAEATNLKDCCDGRGSAHGPCWNPKAREGNGEGASIDPIPLDDSSYGVDCELLIKGE